MDISLIVAVIIVVGGFALFFKGLWGLTSNRSVDRADESYGEDHGF